MLTVQCFTLHVVGSKEAEFESKHSKTKMLPNSKLFEYCPDAVTGKIVHLSSGEGVPCKWS
jgi:hypothetical protein